MMKNPLSTALVLTGLLSAAGCVSPTTPEFANAPLYPAGYSDGCNSAIEGDKNFSTKLIRDEVMFEEDPGYRAGWRQGYTSCRLESDTGTGDGIFRGEADPAY